MNLMVVFLLAFSSPFSIIVIFSFLEQFQLMQDSLLLIKRSKFLMLSGTLEATQMFTLWFLHQIIIWGVVRDAYVEGQSEIQVKMVSINSRFISSFLCSLNPNYSSSGIIRDGRQRKRKIENQSSLKSVKPEFPFDLQQLYILYVKPSNPMLIFFS